MLSKQHDSSITLEEAEATLRAPPGPDCCRQTLHGGSFSRDRNGKHHSVADELATVSTCRSCSDQVNCAASLRTNGQIFTHLAGCQTSEGTTRSSGNMAGMHRITCVPTQVMRCECKRVHCTVHRRHQTGHREYPLSNIVAEHACLECCACPVKEHCGPESLL